MEDKDRAFAFNRLMSALGPGCVKTQTLFFKVEFWPRLGGNSSQEIFRHHREGTTKEKDSGQYPTTMQVNIAVCGKSQPVLLTPQKNGSGPFTMPLMFLRHA
jgi:hypothetical protein